MYVNKFFFKSFAASCSVVLIGCGGGGDGVIQTSSDKTYKVTGTVPGTLIEAFCKDGSYHSVESTKTATEKHPFEIDLPTNVDCRFVMVTNNEDKDPRNHIITPILLENDDGKISAYFQLSSDVDLGHVNLSLSGQGVQNPMVLELNNNSLDIRPYSDDPMDRNNNGIPDMYDDDDHDGNYNRYDDDDDNNGIVDRSDDNHKDDYDRDGVYNDYDVDDNNDGYDDSSDKGSKGSYDKGSKGSYDKGSKGSYDKGSKGSNDYYYSTSTNVILPVAYKENAGRLLGSQCAQCHGTNGISVNSWDSIAGEDNLHDEMFEYDEPIMLAQARGYTNMEISLIEDWLMTLKKYKD